jgi:hypothetical protein
VVSGGGGADVGEAAGGQTQAEAAPAVGGLMLEVGGGGTRAVAARVTLWPRQIGQVLKDLGTVWGTGRELDAVV